MFTNSKAAGLNMQELQNVSWLGDRYYVCSDSYLFTCHIGKRVHADFATGERLSLSGALASLMAWAFGYHSSPLSLS